MPMLGYARVSTVEQDTALQLDAMSRAGVDTVFQEKRSGVASRPQLEAALDALLPGDILVVYKVDRLARSLTDLLRIIDRVESVGAAFKSLTEPIDTSSPLGRMMLQILGSFAEFERSTIRQRCDAGREAARARGVRFGRPNTVDWPRVRNLIAEGFNQSEAARIVGASPSTVNKWVRSGNMCIPP